MDKEEIDYWLRYFSKHNHGFMSEDGKKITLFKVFQELKELQYLLKIKNDYIKELQQENQSLEKENKILRENAEHNDKVVDKVNWENQKLKNQLEEYKLITIDYQELEARNQELKEQVDYLRRSIERKEETIIDLQNEIVPYTNEYVCKLENQQKEFVDWLENQKNIYPYDISDYSYEDIINTILSKYEDIIEK